MARCSHCEGSGFIMTRTYIDTSGAYTRGYEPCKQCHGGAYHCCEGDQVQPEKDTDK